MEIKLKVTQEKYDELFSLEDWLNFGSMTNIEMYNMMLNFVVDDEGNAVPPEEARLLFKKVSKKQWPDYIAKFTSAIRDAYVSPTNGGS